MQARTLYMPECIDPLKQERNPHRNCNRYTYDFIYKNFNFNFLFHKQNTALCEPLSYDLRISINLYFLPIYSSRPPSDAPCRSMLGAHFQGKIVGGAAIDSLARSSESTAARFSAP